MLEGWPPSPGQSGSVARRRSEEADRWRGHEQDDHNDQDEARTGSFPYDSPVVTRRRRGRTWWPVSSRAKTSKTRALKLATLLTLWLFLFFAERDQEQDHRDQIFSHLSSAPCSNYNIANQTKSRPPSNCPASMIKSPVFWRPSLMLFANANPDANRLYEDLMMTYNKIVRPVANESERVVVRLSLKLSQLIDVNLKNQMMTTNVWLNQEWFDYKLKWEPSEYNGIQDINLPAEQIWLPDIVLYNSAEGYFAVSIMTKAKVRFDGHVTWNPPAIFRSSCQIDISYFPFDSQSCRLKFGSWTFGTKIDLRHVNDTNGTIEHGTDLSEYYQNVEWDIMAASAKRNVITYTCCPNDFYPDVTFTFLLRRKPLFYTVNLILPCIGITILSFLVFYLPSDSGEKVTLTISILLSLVFFLSVLIETIPSTSLAMPLLGKYLVFTLVLITVSVCATVCVLNIHFRTPSTHSMPIWFKRWCVEILPKYLFVNVPQYQTNQQTYILPEQLIYPHNQAYLHQHHHPQHPAAAQRSGKTGRDGHVKQQSKQQAGNTNSTTRMPSSIHHDGQQQLDQAPTGDMGADSAYRQQLQVVMKRDYMKSHASNKKQQQHQNTTSGSSSCGLAAGSLFLPYLQSEAARRLQMQRSRSSERDQKSSLSDNQTNNNLNYTRTKTKSTRPLMNNDNNNNNSSIMNNKSTLNNCDIKTPTLKQRTKSLDKQTNNQSRSLIKQRTNSDQLSHQHQRHESMNAVDSQPVDTNNNDQNNIGTAGDGEEGRATKNGSRRPSRSMERTASRSLLSWLLKRTGSRVGEYNDGKTKAIGRRESSDGHDKLGSFQSQVQSPSRHHHHGGPIQHESSSSMENDYQYHNHFQARASICSTNLWRVGPQRLSAVPVAPNYPTYYRPLVHLARVRNSRDDLALVEPPAAAAPRSHPKISELNSTSFGSSSSAGHLEKQQQTTNNQAAAISTSFMVVSGAPSQPIDLKAPGPGSRSHSQQTVTTPSPTPPPPLAPLFPLGVGASTLEDGALINANCDAIDGNTTNIDKHRDGPLVGRASLAHHIELLDPTFLGSSSHHQGSAMAANTSQIHPNVRGLVATPTGPQLHGPRLFEQPNYMMRRANELEATGSIFHTNLGTNNPLGSQPTTGALIWSGPKDRQQQQLHYGMSPDFPTPSPIQAVSSTIGAPFQQQQPFSINSGHHHYQRHQNQTLNQKPRLVIMPRSRSTDHRLAASSMAMAMRDHDHAHAHYPHPQLVHSQRPIDLDVADEHGMLRGPLLPPAPGLPFPASIPAGRVAPVPLLVSTGPGHQAPSGSSSCALADRGFLVTPHSSNLSQNPFTIGRALGQAYMQRLRRQPAAVYAPQHAARANATHNAHSQNHRLITHLNLKSLDSLQQQHSHQKQQQVLMMRRSKSHASLEHPRARLPSSVGANQTNSNTDDAHQCPQCIMSSRLNKSDPDDDMLDAGRLMLINDPTNDNNIDPQRGSRRMTILRHINNNNEASCFNGTQQRNQVNGGAGAPGRQQFPLHFHDDNQIGRSSKCRCPKLSLQHTDKIQQQLQTNRYSQQQQTTKTIKPEQVERLKLAKLISEVDKAIQNAMFIAQHIDNLDEFESVKENWKYIAMVVDRIFLIVFLFACIVGTVAIFAMVPWHHYLFEKPIDLQLIKLSALNVTSGDGNDISALSNCKIH